jgi:hypothetical protein
MQAEYHLNFWAQNGGRSEWCTTVVGFIVNHLVLFRVLADSNP